MVRVYFFFCVILSAISMSAFGKVVEVENFKKISDFAKEDMLVILDIDDTLLIPVQTLGTDVWFIHRLEEHKKNLCDFNKALDRALAEWEAIRHLTKVKLVEDGTDVVVGDLQKKNIVVMGLTTQGLALATRTVRQLASLNIDLSKTAPSKEDHYFFNGLGVLYRNGILFTSGTAKGEALFKLFDIIGYLPKQIVFINDKLSHLKDVESTAIARGIDFIGLRYSYSDQRVLNFNHEITDIQWQHSTLDHLMSDEEALQMKGIL